ncbi:MAG TPA: hypothetical protein VIK30_11145, partial [Polyangia bacterium]
MRTLCKSLWVGVIAVTAAGGTARGSDDRLLVVVESGPGVSVDACDVRETIGHELGMPVVAPGDAEATGA